MTEDGTNSAERHSAKIEAAGFRYRMRMRVAALTILSGALLLAGGAIGLHYVDAIGETLRRSTDITAPLLSDVLEITQAGRRARASVRAAAEQCNGIEAARRELDGFDATSTHVALDLAARAAVVGASRDLDRIVTIESRFATVGREILGSCVRNAMISGRIAAAGDAVQGDLDDLFVGLRRLEERADELARQNRPMAEVAAPHLPDPLQLARLRSDLGGFNALADVVGGLGSPQAVGAFESRRAEKLRDIRDGIEQLRPAMVDLGLEDEHDRLVDLVADLADRVVGERGLLAAQRMLLDAHASLAGQRVELGTIDDDYFRAVRMLETTARRLDTAARRQVVESTREAYTVVAATSAVLLLFVLALAADLARRITRPIEQFTEHVRRLRASDDFDEPLAPALVRRRDEIGVLARAYCDLIAELGEARRRLESESQAQIRRQYERLQAAIATMPQGFFLLDADERLVVWNDSFMRMYGFKPGELTVGMTTEPMVARRRSSGACPPTPEEPLFRRAIADRQPHQRIEEFVDGRVVVITASPTADGGAAVTHEDITARKRAEEEIEHLARFDAATGLANRASFRERIVQAFEEREPDLQVALLYVDLDHFKTVNDGLGHSIGDRLLEAAAERIVECTGEWETVGRLGGDEFAILQTRLYQPMAATDLARRLSEALVQPYEVDGSRIVISASIGIAVAPDDAADADALLAHADMALNRAKSEGRGVTRFFEPEMDASLQKRRALESDLRSALDRGEFELHYQPVVGARSGRVEGFEALLRWRHPERGLVSPSEFVPLAEETGLIGEIGAWVLREATRAAALWPSDLRVAVNISPVQIRTRVLTLDVLSAIGRSGLKPDRLELEITEGILLVDTEATLATLAQLRDFGVRIAMDDFGTGYSSLGYLRRFAFDKVKIDQSFVRGLDETSDAVAIVRAVTGLCSSLGITTTAEGVETEAQRDRLLQEGCDQFQGWLFGHPMPEAEIAPLLAREAERSGAAPQPSRRRGLPALIGDACKPARHRI